MSQRTGGPADRDRRGGVAGTGWDGRLDMLDMLDMLRRALIILI
jgi:hypothetical protein